MTMPAWGNAQIARFLFRVALFSRRGVSEPRAEQLADRLARRDYDRDDRRLCLECGGLQRGSSRGNGPATSRCAPVSLAASARASAQHKQPPFPHEPVIDILQRCAHFTWQKP